MSVQESEEERIYKLNDPRKIDRQVHSAYVKWCAWAGLHENIDVEKYADKDVYYMHEMHCFCSDNDIVPDWKLNAQATDKMFQYAIKTRKKEEQAKRKGRVTERLIVDAC
jgi:hypothetical protein